jgi:hypothetical protein
MFDVVKATRISTEFFGSILILYGTVLYNLLYGTYAINRCFTTVLRIRIHMFLDLPDPDLLVRGMDPDPDPALDPDPSIVMQK